MNVPVAILILLPSFGFAINFLLGKRMPKAVVGFVGCGTILVCFLISVLYFVGIQRGQLESSGHDLLPWIQVGNFSIDFSFLIDRLSVWMLLIITGVGFLIHVYSTGYMHHDEGYHRFFAYLNLFVFFMQILVLGANYVVTFIGWEGVGLCSYLLIGFWFKNTEYNNAAKKAFIMNRIGDLGFLLGMFLIFNVFGSLNFNDIFTKASAGTFAVNDTFIVFITLLLFVGAVGKSAQIPLFTWLPDAMAGPTPVSALIHAATMVTAGIYLVVRSHVLFALAPFTLDVIAWVGIATALMAATIGIAQNDIKKVLAYSTVSQLGLMFVALGVGAYDTAMFHLTTHAFFKALLFLGAGSVIHGMSGEQDIRLMGGLRKKMPATYITFLIGTIAISGIPPLAGFFSKDEILAKAYEHQPVLWFLGLLVSLLTALYMFRLLFMVFFGSFRGSDHQRDHLHESPPSMTIPLIVLAFFSAIGGSIGMPEIFRAPHWLAEYFRPLLADLRIEELHHLSPALEWVLMLTSVVAAIAMAFIASRLYKKTEPISGIEEAPKTGLLKLPAHKYYVDEVYDFLIVKPVDKMSRWIYRFIESDVIDGLVNGVSNGVREGGNYIRRVQTGNIGFYIFAMVIGIIVLLFVNSYFIQ
jgi:NADH-quinone oxidoreductase subunit L